MTERAVVAFQRSRGIDDDGICGSMTWAELVEAGYELGDRLLYLHSPMLRGEDIAELQRRLGRLGFDAGRVDGICGPDTTQALEEFQRNVGLGIDGICGPATIDALDRYGRRLGDVAPVATIRERELLRTASTSLEGHRLALGDVGGLAAPAAALRRSLADGGVRVLTVHHPDGSAHARQANTFGAAVYLGLVAHHDDPELCFYEVPGFVSEGGRLLAGIAAEELRAAVGSVRVTGTRMPVLRETRMPAVVCRLPIDAWSADRAPLLGAAWACAVRRWVVARSDITTLSGG